MRNGNISDQTHKTCVVAWKSQHRCFDTTDPTKTFNVSVNILELVIRRPAANKKLKVP